MSDNKWGLPWKCIDKAQYVEIKTCDNKILFQWNFSSSGETDYNIPSPIMQTVIDSFNVCNGKPDAVRELIKLIDCDDCIHEYNSNDDGCKLCPIGQLKPALDALKGATDGHD